MRQIRRRKVRLQSAMEYLMTYGWAILIIAVVLGALFQLGVFNTNSFAPRAPPGSCRIFRSPAGGSPNLEGICTGQLPQYVSIFQAGSSKISTSLVMQSPTQVTVTLWLNPLTIAQAGCPTWVAGQGQFSTYPVYGIYALQAGTTGNGCYSLSLTQILIGGSITTGIPSAKTFYHVTVFANANQHYFVALTYNGVTLTEYLNGVPVNSIAASGTMTYDGNQQTSWSQYPFAIGSAVGAGAFNGIISNIQVYNTSISASDIQALYTDGIGAAPLNLQNLVGWWPLNGDANDYSGNNNNGAPTGIIYTNQWLNGYTPP